MNRDRRILTVRAALTEPDLLFKLVTGEGKDLCLALNALLKTYEVEPCADLALAALSVMRVLRDKHELGWGFITRESSAVDLWDMLRSEVPQ
jgi:hypothetical protein